MQKGRLIEDGADYFVACPKRPGRFVGTTALLIWIGQFRYWSRDIEPNYFMVF
jgi:hypothetical protein